MIEKQGKLCEPYMPTVKEKLEQAAKDKKCYAYFKGKDGLGTCATECQWYREGEDCPWWRP